MKKYKDHYTIDEILAIERKYGKYIDYDVLAEFFRKHHIRPNADHMYHRSVRDTMARHMFELLRDSNAKRARRYEEPDDTYEAPNSYYHPKGMSNASIELLKNDEVWYESIHRALTSTLMEQKLW
jgi:hypothetical protein